MSARPSASQLMGSQGPMVASMPQGFTGASVGPMGAPGDLPQGARYYGTVKTADGKIVDQYMIPGETRQVSEEVPVAGVQTVYDTQVIYEEKEITIQVPKTVMEDVEITYQVPAMETKTHTLQRPKTVMEEKEITVQEPRTVMETQSVQIPAYVMAQQTVMKQKIVEYERPKIVQGKMLRTYEAGQQYQTGAVTYTSGPVTMSEAEAKAAGLQYGTVMAGAGYQMGSAGAAYQMGSTTVQQPYVPQQTPDDAISA